MAFLKHPIWRVLFMVLVLSGLSVSVMAAPIDVHTPSHVVRKGEPATSGSDLIVTDIRWDNDSDADAQVAPDTPLTFSVDIYNQGNAASGLVELEITQNAQTLLKTETMSLKPGESTTVIAANPWKPTAGDYMITAIVRGDVAENSDNNDYTEHVRVADTVLTAPYAALKRGFNKLVYSDDFHSQDTIDVNATGNEGYHWYVSRPWGEPDQRLNEDYTVENGVLTVKTANKSAWAWSLCTIDARKTSGFGFNHGYLEYAVRLPYTSDDEEKLKGGVRNPGVWALATDSVWASITGVHNVRSVEVDWLEYKGTKYQGGAQFHICLHDVLDLTGNDNGYQDHHASQGTKFFHEKGYPVGGDGEFHVFGCAWSAGMLEYYLDGKLIHVKTYAEDGFPDPMPSGTGSSKPGIFSPLEEQYMPIVLGAVDEFRMEVDYVRVWQSDGTVESEPFYSRLATAFLGKHLTDSNGKLITVVTDRNYEQLIQAQADWDILLSDEQDEVNAALGVSYDELLTTAKGVADGTIEPQKELPPEQDVTPRWPVYVGIVAAALLVTAAIIGYRANQK